MQASNLPSDATDQVTGIIGRWKRITKAGRVEGDRLVMTREAYLGTDPDNRPDAAPDVTGELVFVDCPVGWPHS